MKMMSMVLALVLALGMGACAVAEAPAATLQAAEPVLVDGPLLLEEGADASKLLTALAGVTYKKDDIVRVLTLEIAAEPGAAEGTLGELRQMNVTATMETKIDAVRYAVTPAEDGKAMTVALEIDVTSDGRTDTFADTLTLTPGEDSTLAVESEMGGPTELVNG